MLDSLAVDEGRLGASEPLIGSLRVTCRSIRLLTLVLHAVIIYRYDAGSCHPGREVSVRQSRRQITA